MSDSRELFLDFQKRWSIEKVRDMSLEEYTRIGNKNTFTYWIESKLKDLGSIRGPAGGLGNLKFGICHCNGKEYNKVKQPHLYSQDKQYTWLEEYGKMREEAFKNIKNKIIEIIQYSQNNQLEKIDNVDLKDILKWKIAFHYQNVDDMKIVCIFNQSVLKEIVKGEHLGENLSTAQIYEKLLKDKTYTLETMRQEKAQPLWEKYGENLPNEEKPMPNNENTAKQNNIAKSQIPLNQILYGPPGTGKTYNTIEKALEILGEDTKSKNRQELKKLFEDYKSKGQIEFVTFHQSYGYEEFVEGIKPVMNEENNMIYEVQNGIFREICKKALANYQESQESHQSFNLEELFQAYALSLKEKLDQGENIAFYQSMKIFSINLAKSGEIYSIGIGTNPQSLQNLSLKIFLRDYQDFKQGKIKNYKDIKPTYESTSLWYGNAIYYFELYKKIKEFEEQEFQPTNQEKKKSELKPYILIIDEINRGNISKIFGELITLIEPSKRIGADEEIRVTLPYSNDSFGVPKNLYIIGTMNTADRSITTLDTALRRRFEFIEMMPNSQRLVNLKVDHEGEGINLKELLEAINQRIEFLYDREKTIGHALFLSEDKEHEGKISLKQLKGIFQNKIIPLLQEYFYNDYEAINAILNGNGMIRIKEDENKYLSMGKFDSFVKDKGMEDKKVFEITPKDIEDVWDNAKTYLAIYDEKNA